MPIELTEARTPAGHPLLRNDGSGRITGPEVQKLMDAIAEGGRYHGWRQLHVLAKGAEMSKESRALVSQQYQDAVQTAVAVVVPSAVLRVTIQFILKVTGDQRTKLFSDEASALEWLDAAVAR